MPIIRERRLDERLEQPYLGIRVRTPCKGMFTVEGILRKELAPSMVTRGDVYRARYERFLTDPRLSRV